MTRTRQTKGSTSSTSSPCCPFFCAIGNKNAGNEQQNARRERLFIRKSALSAIFVADSVPGSIICEGIEMSLFVNRFNSAFFVLWVTWCGYRGVLCSLTSIPDFLAPANYSEDYPALGLLLLAFPFVAPFVCILASAGCLLIKAGSRWCSVFILVFSIATILFRILIKPNLFVPFWF